MSSGWMQVVGSDGRGGERTPLRPGLTRVGGGNADIVVEAPAADELHVWDEPPRAVFVGDGPRPTLGGNAFDEVPLGEGDEVRWGGVTLRFCFGGSAPARLEEIGGAEPARAGSGGLSARERDAWERIRAGLLVDMGVADRVTVKRWQKAVREGSFDAAEAAREITARTTAAPDENRMVSRSSQIFRDFLMMSLQKGAHGAGRRAKQATRSGVAFLVAQGTALAVFALIVLAALLLMRFNGTSIDGILDKLLPG